MNLVLVLLASLCSRNKCAKSVSSPPGAGKGNHVPSLFILAPVTPAIGSRIWPLLLYLKWHHKVIFCASQIHQYAVTTGVRVLPLKKVVKGANFT